VGGIPLLLGEVVAGAWGVFPITLAFTVMGGVGFLKGLDAPFIYPEDWRERAQVEQDRRTAQYGRPEMPGRYYWTGAYWAPVVENAIDTNDG
jgi:hypothetical protein